MKILLGAAALVGVALVSLPWWAGVIARPFAKAHGLDIGDYERVGYSRYRLHKVTYTRPGVTVTADLLETDTPLLWAWRTAAGRGSATSVDHWAVVVTDQPDKKPTGQFGMLRLHALLNRLQPGLLKWLPQAVVRDGAVRWPNGGLTLGEAQWNGHQLLFHGLGWQRGSADGAISFEAGKIIAVDATQGADLKGHVRWSGADAAGEFSVWAQRLPVQAHFGERGWAPVEAKAEASDWTVPSARLGLGAKYAPLHGNGQIAWRDDGFQLSLQASAEPLQPGGVPPLTLRAEAKGDRRSWTITALQLAAPFANVSLSAPVTAGFDGRMRSGPAQLAFQADLSRQSWIAAAGRAEGEVRLTAGAGEPVGATFTTALEALSWRNVSVQRASAAGTLAWPRLTLDRLELAPDASSLVTAHGGYDFAAKTVTDAKAEGHLALAWLKRWLPAGLAAGDLRLNVSASGPVSDLVHAGELSATEVHYAPLKPVALKATWQGHGPAVEKAAVHLTAGATTLDAEGGAEPGRVTLTALHFAPAGKPTWQLSAPATIAWRPSLRIENLRLEGQGSRLVVAPSAGSIRVEAAGIESAWWRDLFDLPSPDWRIGQLTFTGDTTGERLKFTLQAEGAIGGLLPDSARITLAATGDEHGVQLTRFQAAENEQVLAHAQGRLPVTWDLRASPHLRVEQEAPLELQATTAGASPFWSRLAQGFGFNLQDPVAEVRLAGTLRRPTGELQLTVARLAFESEKVKFPLPAVEKLTVSAKADRDGITLTNLGASLDGQQLSASGRLPLNDSAWRQLWGDRKNFNWSAAEGRVDIAGAELGPIARYAPNYLATQGKLELHAAFRGGKFSGGLKLRDAATRPLPVLGIVQEVTADVALDGRTVKIESFAGKLGGQPVAVQGTVDFPAGGAPKFALTLKGEGVPLVRRAGVLLRCDLDLRAESDPAGNNRIAGTVNVTDCFLLSDLRALLPSGEKGLARPAPYFSIETEPYDRWGLAVELRAAHTVRIRTALFDGTASGRFQLGGTLGEPRAIGEASVDQGQVIFPFVNFDVQLGIVRLTGADPYHPQLNVNATARRDNYDLRMEAHGPADQPILTFSANPALVSEQVLLMVMAGQAPTQDLIASTGPQRLTRIGAYFGQSLIRGLGGGDRLEVTSGERVSDKGHETYELEYKLNRRWSAVGEYDEFDEFNAGLKWRIYTGGATHEPK
ncbi:MAG TPA: translocation/assembly module TamB domain-containing protein [Opitutaceae bacterium]|nr:translocation/assembly module TamB domain-containing protein [Opitutaceae bacterium]